MNAILLGPCKGRVPIDGSLSNAFEYFYFSWLKNKNVYLIVDTTKDAFKVVKKYLTLKYNINEDSLNNIILFNKQFLKLNNLILFEMVAIDNFERYKNYLIAKNVYALSGSKKHALKCQYFVEYEHLAPKNTEVNYRSKIYFDILRKPRFQKSFRFVNTRDPDYIKKDNEILRCDLNKVSNIFEQFSEMIYIQHPIFFDVKPRLFQECMYFGVPFEFIKHHECFDGANYRAHDFDLNSRRMDENDEIVCLLIQ